MSKRKWFLPLIAMLLCAALPVAALADATEMTARDVWRETRLLLPLSAEARDIAFTVEDGSLAQVSFTFGGTPFVLRLRQTPAPEDVSGGLAGYDAAEPYEEYAAYQCAYADNGKELVAWWFDAQRSVSGALYCPSSASADFDWVLYDVFAGLRRGASYAGCASYADGAFALTYPLVQAEDEALTDKLNASLLQGVQAIAAAYAPDARLDNAVMSVDLTGKVFTAEWGGTLVAPGAAYEEYLLFTVHVDCETGEPAPLRALLDTDALAEAVYPRLPEYMTSQDWEDATVDDAQRAYLEALSLEDWKVLLRNADFPTDAGWPPVLASWRDGGYFRDGNEEEYPCLVLYVGVPHALQTQITLALPFAELELDLMELLHVR